VSEIAPRNAVSALVAAIQDKNEAVQEAAITALGRAGAESHDAVTGLLNLVTNDKAKPSLARAAVEAVARHTDPRVLPTLIECLANKKLRDRLPYSVFSDIDETGHRVFPLLLTVANDTKRTIECRTEALAVFSQYDADLIGPDVVNALVALTDHDAHDHDVCHAAIDRLEELGARARSAIPALLDLAQKNVCGWTWSVFAELDPDGAQSVPTLTRMLASENKDVVEIGLLALGAYGQDAAAAVPAITALLKHKSKAIRKKAKEALEEIQ
jgi:HEAT repeat protein